MSLGQDIIDIYTKSSVYYLRLQYLVICYLIVLAGAFFILPLPREMGINGNARLIVGGLLYIGFAVLLVYAPKLLKSSVGRFLSYDEEIEEVENELNQLSENEENKQVELEQELWNDSSIKITIVSQKDFVLMSKKHIIATNVFFQCLLVELFCLVVLINSDYSLLISNSLTQHVADVFSNYVGDKPRQGFFVISSSVMAKNSYDDITYLPFSQFSYMAESIFFIYFTFIISYVIRFIAIAIFLRPILKREDIFPVIKNAETTKKKIWAILGTFVMFIVSICCVFYVLVQLNLYISQIETRNHYIYLSFMLSLLMANILIFFRFIEDWYKRIFHKF